MFDPVCTLSSDSEDDQMYSIQQIIPDYANMPIIKKKQASNQGEKGDANAPTAPKICYVDLFSDESDDDDVIIVEGQKSESKKEVKSASDLIREAQKSRTLTQEQRANLCCNSSDSDQYVDPVKEQAELRAMQQKRERLNKSIREAQKSRTLTQEERDNLCCNSSDSDQYVDPVKEQAKLRAMQQEKERLNKPVDLNQCIAGNEELLKARKNYVNFISSAILSTGKTRLSVNELAPYYTDVSGTNFFQDFSKLGLGVITELNGLFDGKLKVYQGENNEFYFETSPTFGLNRVLLTTIQQENAEEAALSKEKEEKNARYQANASLRAPPAKLESVLKAAPLSFVASDKSAKEQFFDSIGKQSNANLSESTVSNVSSEKVVTPLHQNIPVSQPVISSRQDIAISSHQKHLFSSSESELEYIEKLPASSTIQKSPDSMPSPAIPSLQKPFSLSDSDQEIICNLPTNSNIQKPVNPMPSSSVIPPQQKPLSPFSMNSELPEHIKKAINEKLAYAQQNPRERAFYDLGDQTEMDQQKSSTFVKQPAQSIPQQMSSTFVKQPPTQSIPQHNENPLRQELVAFLSDSLSKQPEIRLSLLRKEFERKIGKRLGNEMCKQIFGFQPRSMRHAITSLEQFQIKKIDGVAFVIQDDDYLPTDEDDSDYERDSNATYVMTDVE